MKNYVITIARGYGSGGKTIGKMLSRELDIEYYDRELLRRDSDESGISEHLFAQADEKLKSKGPKLLKVRRSAYTGQLLPPGSEDFTSYQNLFNYQAKVIKDLAEKESCVIVGRCADFVLKDYPNVMSVFIHADKDFCMERSLERNSMTRPEMERFIEKTDKYRGDFYRYYTGHQWEDARNYDLCLNSGKLGFEKCVEAIKGYMKVRFE